MFWYSLDPGGPQQPCLKMFFRYLFVNWCNCFVFLHNCGLVIIKERQIQIRLEEERKQMELRHQEEQKRKDEEERRIREEQAQINQQAFANRKVNPTPNQIG